MLRNYELLACLHKIVLYVKVPLKQGKVLIDVKNLDAYLAIQKRSRAYTHKFKMCIDLIYDLCYMVQTKYVAVN